MNIVLDLLAALAGLLLISYTLWDTFRTVVLPRRVTSRLRVIWVFYRLLWPGWRRLVLRLSRGGARETLLSLFGPLALLMQTAIWATGLILGFALLLWGFGPDLNDPIAGPTFGTTLYFSGVTFLTLGFGDVRPVSALARLLAVAEAGVGFAFLALVISYLPTLYQAFSRREVVISLLDARAGSPPSAGELLRRCDEQHDVRALLAEWEVWSAEVLESHMSYPALALFRSLHDHQSWLATLTTILDTSALMLSRGPGNVQRQARLTFAMARHTAVDLVQVLDVEPIYPDRNRLAPGTYAQLQAILDDIYPAPADPGSTQEQLRGLRQLYEPYVTALSRFLHIPLPRWLPSSTEQDAWEASPYDDMHWQRLQLGDDADA
ncbi:MAG TPA: potassium channel family protein [Candidatus Sulfomarinibacteraceae bacterium]|nr:potassium channel family protein [Candidatus Sulfomarinibacteraceae bacterium]